MKDFLMACLFVQDGVQLGFAVYNYIQYTKAEHLQAASYWKVSIYLTLVELILLLLSLLFSKKKKKRRKVRE